MLMFHITKPKGESVLKTVGTETTTTWLPTLLFPFSTVCLSL